MKRMLWIIPLLLAMMAAAAPGPRRPQPGEDPRQEWTGRDVQVGDAAPEIALPRLEPFLKAAPGETPAKLQIEKLSEWRGKQPVLLVFSSYT